MFGLLKDWITRNIDYWQAVLGFVLLFIILFMPGGLVEGWHRLLNAVQGDGPRRRRVAGTTAATREGS